ncbi:probable pathogenesis-related protein ARB_02861 [Sitophilus oryzae]|uniref:Probable pathogenesis-related protein ARB_02861 n=1 Tax=Sitophilus oryzae TaxID=7048 RepID=A0A6J2X2C3_SITOR|nr:probable pathogenesis-related protein ARB_02861 [Sitophilus oryzae]
MDLWKQTTPTSPPTDLSCLLPATPPPPPPADLSWDEPGEGLWKQTTPTSPPTDLSCILPATPPPPPPADLSWDEPGEGYNPTEKCLLKPIILPIPPGLSKKQKKAFRERERQRHALFTAPQCYVFK